jgi:hypothetical protein
MYSVECDEGPGFCQFLVELHHFFDCIGGGCESIPRLPAGGVPDQGKGSEPFAPPPPHPLTPSSCETPGSAPG